MTMPTTRVVRLALMPGYAEALEKRAIRTRDRGWGVVAKHIKYTRNSLYVGIAVIAIAAVAATLSDNGSIMHDITVIVGSMGVAVTWSAAKKLYRITSPFVKVAIPASANKSY